MRWANANKGPPAMQLRIADEEFGPARAVGISQPLSLFLGVRFICGHLVIWIFWRGFLEEPTRAHRR
jgi:hypothetical protein